MRNVIVKAADKSVFVICLLMACVFSFSSCGNDDGGGGDGSSSTSILSIVDTSIDVFSVEINVKFSAVNLEKQVPDSPQPSEFGVLASVDCTPSIENCEFKLCTSRLNTDNTTFTVRDDYFKSNTTYNYVPYIKVGDNYLYGEAGNFKTKAADVNLSMSVGSVSLFEAKIKYECTGSDYDNIDRFGVFYSRNISYVSNLDSLTKAQNFVIQISKLNDSITLAGLSQNATYYLVCYAKVGSEYFLGEVKSLKTKELIFQEGAVDLGLSVKWASCNLGATRPEEYGDYYAWGETTPKSYFRDSTSVFYQKSVTDMWYMGVINEDNYLNPAYDAATQKLGAPWRMPTSAEINELFAKCRWVKYYVNNVNGYLAFGTNGNYIFLPASGYRVGDSAPLEGSMVSSWGCEILELEVGGAYNYSSNVYIDVEAQEFSPSTYLIMWAGAPVRPVTK